MARSPAYIFFFLCIAIPSSVARIGDAAFRECSSLASFDIPSALTNIGVLFHNRRVKRFSATLVPQSLTVWRLLLPAQSADPLAALAGLTCLLLPLRAVTLLGIPCPRPFAPTR